ncbi:hypothetical protein KFK09_019824 [Dendrobium nobile]|uniref:Protein kinase domain-containing protein n=1 Tax=Dendrobium nobile TaxID=94219 RepID=A0A8T3AQK9_DENNO|nr:hypothetical protein KFK09_019824 [Dendrobium nobile]
MWLKRGCFSVEPSIGKVKLYSYKELRAATGDFKRGNRIGEGGFGSVYKGTLRNGTIVAIKVLSKESAQGAREFLTEITAISDIIHENLVQLYGCCIEGNHKILVYRYLENNSLAQTLLGRNRSKIQFSWVTRSKICIGVARGLAFLHEEHQPPIVHRGIKASNVLLDKNLTLLQVCYRLMQPTRHRRCWNISAMIMMEIDTGLKGARQIHVDDPVAVFGHKSKNALDLSMPYAGR